MADQNKIWQLDLHHPVQQSKSNGLAARVAAQAHSRVVTLPKPVAVDVHSVVHLVGRRVTPQSMQSAWC